MATVTPHEPVVEPGSRSRRFIWVAVFLLVAFPTSFNGLIDTPALRNWSTIFVSVTLQALPFLVLGVVLSAGIAVLVPSEWFARAMPRRRLLAVPVAGVAGAVLPGCECSSIPVARRLVDRGVPAPAALTFLLAAPAVNPVVLVSTAVAFPGRPQMVAARFLASLTTAMVVGFLSTRIRATRDVVARPVDAGHGSHVHDVASAAVADFVQAGGFLVAGGAVVATLQTLVPPDVVDSFAGSAVTGFVALSVLAVVLSICSEADAFVAAGLSQFSLTARLAFLVVGPMVDLKLIALQGGAFGRRFASVFAPLTFLTALGASLVVGKVLL